MPGKDKSIQRKARNAGLDIALQDIVDGLEDQLVVIDSKYRIRFANSAVRRLFRKGTESPIGRLCHKVFFDRDTPCSAPLRSCPLEEVLRSGRATTFIHPIRSQGTDRYLKITAYPLRDSYGNTKAVVELRREP